MANIEPGFRGIVAISTYETEESPLVRSRRIRVNSIDIQKRQEAQQFLPAVGGRNLKRIWFKGTSDTSVTISLPVVEDLAEFLHELAIQQDEFYIDCFYYGSRIRRAIGCKIDNLAFTVEAGSVVNASVSMVAKNVIEKNFSRTYTKGEKLLTWDKCSVTFANGKYPLNDFQSFTYNISNGIKTIKTAASLDPNVLTTAIQDISGQILIYSHDSELGLPLLGDGENELGFNDIIFRIGSLTVRHNVVFNPTQMIPLTANIIVSTVSWVKSDDFYPE